MGDLKKNEMPSPATEDYLKRILVSEENAGGASVSTGALATDLGLTPGTVTAMVKSMAARGLVTYRPYAGVRLTGAGRRAALKVLRRHRLLETFLVRVMGYDWSEVHAEAEQLEHAASEPLIDRMAEMMDHPAFDPHGDPIPDRDGQVPRLEGQDLLTSPLDQELVIRHVDDQSARFLRFAASTGLVPGCTLRILARDEAADTVTVELAGGGRLEMGHRAASKILAATP